MNGMKLKLNPDRTDFIIIGGKNTRGSLIQKYPVTFLQSSIMLVGVCNPFINSQLLILQFF